MFEMRTLSGGLPQLRKWPYLLWRRFRQRLLSGGFQESHRGRKNQSPLRGTLWEDLFQVAVLHGGLPHEDNDPGFHGKAESNEAVAFDILKKNQYRDYAQQFYITIGESNSVFMDALAATKKTVTVEIRGGNGFFLRFDVPNKTVKGWTEDWDLFKKAGGDAPFYLRSGGEIPVVIR